MKMYLWSYKRLSKIITTIIIVLLVLFAFTEEAIAGVTGKIAGTVKDAETGERLPMANCILLGTEMGAACDSEGDYFIVNISPGTYSLQVRMMGYESVTKTGIEVDADHTTIVDFEVRPVAVEVPGITVKAKREIIKLDLSSSSIVSTSEELQAVPLVDELEDYLNMQTGITGWTVRGGSLDETQFMTDGLFMVDNRSNEPIVSPNLSAIEEVNVIKGGFNAEYGNVRSGVINVVTKTGSRNRYHGSVNFRYTPPQLKHRGYSLFDPKNYYLLPYLQEEDSICWLGSDHWLEIGDTDSYYKYPYFQGWINVSDIRLGDSDTTNDATPEECRDLFIWNHTCEGASELIPEGYTGFYHEREYGNKPDWSIDVGFGGPLLPGLTDKLTFFASYKTTRDAFGLPVSRDYYEEENSLLKLTYYMSNSMKLSFLATYGETKTVSRYVQWWDQPSDYVRNGQDIFNTPLATGDGHAHRAGLNIYTPSSLSPWDVYQTLGGITFEHSLSPSTFYSLQVSYLRSKNFTYNPLRWRDTTTIRYFGNDAVDELPYGFNISTTFQDMEDEMITSNILNGGMDFSEVKTINVKFDLTSQINKNNQIKMGGVFNYDEMDTYYRNWAELYNKSTDWEAEWQRYPSRAGVYLQDKIEFGGLIANVGVRLDYNNPNCEWFTVDRYSKYFSPEFSQYLYEEAPNEQAKKQLKISPRFGISHPIGTSTKLFFNYGWFYALPPAEDMYLVHYWAKTEGIQYLGNPSAEMPQTQAYELGVEQELLESFLVSITGYYKDVNDQTGRVSYTNFEGSVDYSTIENNNYQDTRGFELSIYKRVGNWITGWINYDYMVTTSGYVGRRHYYEDPRLERNYGIQNPYQERPIARPEIRANINFFTPKDWGPLGNLMLSLNFVREPGNFFTWDPLETGELKQNLQWNDEYNLNARLNYSMKLIGYNFNFFLDVKNALDTKYLHSQGFTDGNDYKAYLNSLHLPMYEGEEYQAAGLVDGNDRPGDVKSEGKPYIDMPDRDFLTYLNPRTITFGVTVNF